MLKYDFSRLFLWDWRSPSPSQVIPAPCRAPSAGHRSVHRRRAGPKSPSSGGMSEECIVPGPIFGIFGTVSRQRLGFKFFRLIRELSRKLTVHRCSGPRHQMQTRLHQRRTSGANRKHLRDFPTTCLPVPFNIYIYIYKR